jgi:hypothetical protein
MAAGQALWQSPDAAAQQAVPPRYVRLGLLPLDHERDTVSARNSAGQLTHGTPLGRVATWPRGATGPTVSPAAAASAGPRG